MQRQYYILQFRKSKLVFTLKSLRNNEIINISSVGVVNSLEIVEYMKKRLISESILRIISDSDSFFTISNEKLLKYYKPMTTIESIETYLNDMMEN